MVEKIQNIPARLKNMAKGGHVAGAADIIDDDLLLTQAQINAIVLGDAVSVSLNYSSPIVTSGTDATVNLSASCSTDADTITIKRGEEVIATGSGRSLSFIDTIALSGTPTVYRADFLIGGLTKNASRSIAAVYFGAGAAYTDATRAIEKTSPAGTYNVTVSENGQYVWFVVPATMTINRATKSGFDFPLEAPENVTIGDVAYKAYRSSNTYDAGTETVVLS